MLGIVLGVNVEGAMFMNCRTFLINLIVGFILSSCTSASYPEARAKEALQEILSKEYNVYNAEIEFSGRTLGVFLPLEELFATDFKEAIMSGKVTNMENLFQPTEKAIDRVEDVLFSISRVMLSTDKKIDFYYLQATDVEKTGMELVFIGQIDDIKRVRFWDIPRSEYRKRIIHEIQLNRAVFSHKPVRQFFGDLNHDPLEKIQVRYFPHTDQKKWTREFFFQDALGYTAQTSRMQWKLLDIRSMPLQDNESMVYAKAGAQAKNPADGREFPPRTLEYLFHLKTDGEKEKIQRIIPLDYLNAQGADSGISFSKAMVHESLPNWDVEFRTPDLTMGDFLARQLTRRLRELTAQDERLYNTFSKVKVVFQYEEKPEPFFLFSAVAPLRERMQVSYVSGQGIHEDILYLWELAAREFVEVIRSYQFEDYRSLRFEMIQGEKPLVWTAAKNNLELFRRRKKKLEEILTLI